MALSGRSLASAALLGLAAILFVPVFADAAAGFSYGSWQYGPQLATVLEYIPVLLVVVGVAVLLMPVVKDT